MIQRVENSVAGRGGAVIVRSNCAEGSLSESFRLPLHYRITLLKVRAFAVANDTNDI